MQTDEFIFFKEPRPVDRTAQRQAQHTPIIVVSFTGYFGGRGTLTDQKTHSVPVPKDARHGGARGVLNGFHPESDVFKLT